MQLENKLGFQSCCFQVAGLTMLEIMKGMKRAASLLSPSVAKYSTMLTRDVAPFPEKKKKEEQKTKRDAT